MQSLLSQGALVGAAALLSLVDPLVLGVSASSSLSAPLPAAPAAVGGGLAALDADTPALTDTDTGKSSGTELRVFYYLGASITLASSLFVIFSYIKFRACRQHPSSLIFWRSVSDVIFSLQFIILFSDAEREHHCAAFSFLFQFSVLASQSWYFMNAVDLLRSMRNPFTDPKANVPMYHVFVWGVSLLTAVAIDASQKDHYRYDMQICWTQESADGALFNYVNWLTFLGPTAFFYFFSIGTIIYAGLRLKKGLQETFDVRQIVLFNGIRYVAGFCMYWTFAGIIYGIIILESNSTSDSRDSATSTEHLPLYATFAVTIAFRGIIDVVIWVYNQKVLQVYRLWWHNLPHDDPADIGMPTSDINRALRREVLIYSTTGISLAVDRANSVPFSPILPTIEQYPFSLDPNEPRNMHSVVRCDVHREDFTEKLNFLGLGSSADENGVVTEASLEAARARAVSVGPEGVPFLDYAPQVFRFLRFQYGIDEDEYTKSIQGETEAMIEKFTEGGRSGSFFYFSEDSKYIVKCWGTGTLLMMADGSTKTVEAIVQASRGGAEQLLMGDDSTPRRVKPGSTSNNTGELFRVQLARGGHPAWTCNAGHILVLKINRPPQLGVHKGLWKVAYYALEPVDDITHIPRVRRSMAFADEARAQEFIAGLKWQPLTFCCTVRDLMGLSGRVRDACQMYQPEVVHFPAPALPLADRLRAAVPAHVVVTPEMVRQTAWVLGMWLTDGSSASPIIRQVALDRANPAHSHTPVIVELEAWYSAVHGVPVVSGVTPSGDLPSPYLAGDDDDLLDLQKLTVEEKRVSRITFMSKLSSSGSPIYQVHGGPVLARLLASYDLQANKRLPFDLLTESIALRTALLEGLLDGAGDYLPSEQVFALAAKDRALLDAVTHLARGLGFTTEHISSKGAVTMRDQDEQPCTAGYRLCISGVALPTLKPVLPYKRCPVTTPLRDHRCSGFTITRAGRGDFWGFELDGNRQCLMADFVVTHNTLTSTEAVFLVKWMPRYVDFMSKNPNTLLCRFCGFHSLTLYNLTIHFMVMQSVYQTRKKIHERYDLKGSYIDRHADLSSAKQSKLNPSASASSQPPPLRSGGFKNVVYKDNDLNRTVRLAESDRAAFLRQVQKDAFFLRDSGIMDYSLLLGVHHTSHVVPAMSPVSASGSFVERASEPLLAGDKAAAASAAGQMALTPLASRVSSSAGIGAPRGVGVGVGVHKSSSTSTSVSMFTKDEGGVQASIIEGPGIYFFGIIDCLQEYNTAKKMERFAKRYLRCKDGNGISSMPPDGYADRFVRFMASMTSPDDDASIPVGAALSPNGQSVSASAPPSQARLSHEEKEDDRHHMMVNMAAAAAADDERHDDKQRLFAGDDSSSSSAIHNYGSVQANNVGGGGGVVSPSHVGSSSSFLNPSSISSTHPFPVHPSSDPTAGGGGGGGGGNLTAAGGHYASTGASTGRTSLHAMGITDADRDATMPTTSGFPSSA